MPDSTASLAAALLDAAASRTRYVLGLVGPPGSGKSTLAETLNAACGVAMLSRVVALDGYHLSNAALDAAGIRGRKGAPHTFDSAAFVAAVEAIRRGVSMRVPRYDRTLHEPVADVITIDADVRIVIVEGNYLLLDSPPWDRIGPLLDESWYLDTPIDECLRGVRARHIAGGLSPGDADAKIERNDRPNAELIAGTRGRATRCVTVGSGVE